MRAAEAELAPMAGLARELRQPAQNLGGLGRRGNAGPLRGSHRRGGGGHAARTAELGSRRAGARRDLLLRDATCRVGRLRREQGRLAEIEASLESYVEEYPRPSSSSAVCSRASTASSDATSQARDELDRLAADDVRRPAGRHRVVLRRQSSGRGVRFPRGRCARPVAVRGTSAIRGLQRLRPPRSRARLRFAPARPPRHDHVPLGARPSGTSSERWR